MQTLYSIDKTPLDLKEMPKEESCAKVNILALQESASSLKTKDDIFGFAKKSENVLQKILYILTLKDYKKEVLEIIENESYKNFNIFENFLIDSKPKTINLKPTALELIDSKEKFEKFIRAHLSSLKQLIDKIKDEIMLTTGSLTQRGMGNVCDIARDINSKEFGQKLKELLH